jgi:hypothetical protein
MDTLDLITGLLAVAAAIASLLFPLGRNGRIEDAENKGDKKIK